MTSLSQNFINHLRFNEDGLIPAIAQDWLDGAVLMMAWMNKESLSRTISSREVHYWSRSRKALWRKGETSGYTQKLKGIRYDCDEDTLLLTIEQLGSISCHTGSRSCFFQDNQEDSQNNSIVLEPRADACSEVFKIVSDRFSNPVEGSYTNHLLDGGDNRILKKIGEESAEFVMACKDADAKSIANEAADLIFHLQVALAHHQVDWRAVLEVLDGRKNTNSQK